MIITMRDVRASLMCSAGARRWFSTHGLDWRAFLRDGISSDELLATGCPMAARVVEEARGRQERK